MRKYSEGPSLIRFALRPAVFKMTHILLFPSDNDVARPLREQ